MLVNSGDRKNVELEQFKKPLTRYEKGSVSTTDSVRLNFLDPHGWQSTVDYEYLLKTTQNAEKILRDRMNAHGYMYLGCGENRTPQGHILGGSVEHVIEHACCVVLDNHAKTGEITTGLTSVVGSSRDRSGALRYLYQTLISPPPSMSIKEGVNFVNLTLQAINKHSLQKIEIDLLGI